MHIRHHAATRPDDAAAIAASSGETLTWRTLDERSNQLAHLCRSMGLGPGDNIAVLMENNLAFFEVTWAALRSGLYLTTLNRYLTAEESAYILRDCGAALLVSTEAMAEVAAELPARVPNCRRWLMVGEPASGYESYAEALAIQPKSALEEEPAGSFMLYSSGTTGRPKGIKRPLPEVGIAEEGAIAVLPMLRDLWGFGQDTVYLSPAPLYHSAPAGFTSTAQALGATVIMMERFDPSAALEYIERYRVTHSQWVPTMFSRMLKLPAAAREDYDLSTHQVAVHAAAPCPVKVKEQMMQWWGPILHEYYGGTELNGLTYVSPEDWASRPGTVGCAILGTLRICDDDGTELPPGQTGLVYFAQDVMPFAYHNDPDKTAAAQHPRHPGWSTLGDVGYLDEDGYLFLTDRATFMIISGGVNIYPQEIEDALVVHPKVADAAVVGVPNEDMGEEVKAVVQLVPAIDPTPEVEAELLAYCREQLAHYKCPRSVDFEAELPRLPTGKLYKRLLKDRYWGREGSKIV